MRNDKLAWSVNIKGCRLDPNGEAKYLAHALRAMKDSLYETYLLNHAAADALRPARYAPEYFIAEIQKRL